MTKRTDLTSYLFEIHHGSNVIRIADDWSGQVLIERIYYGLRQARQSRDTEHVPLASPAPGSEGASLMIEAAMFHGFQRVDDTATYQATADQIVARMTATHEQGRKEALQDVGP